MTALPLITLLTWLPIIGALVVILLPSSVWDRARHVALAFSGATLGMCLLLLACFDPSAGLQMCEKHAWIPGLGVEYFVGVDGLGMIMVLLAGILTPFGILAAWRQGNLTKGYFSLFLLLEAGVIGTFTALNFFHWFLFWELSLIPAFFLIKLWGGAQRTHAAMQFFIYTMAGSLAMLLAFQAIFVATGTFDFISLAEKGRSGELTAALAAKLGWKFLTARQLTFVIFCGVFLGLAVKVPLVPFHIWLPAAYAEAPVGTSMVLTGLMSKMGVYGFLRILMPIFPDQMRMVLTPLMVLAVITIVFAAYNALAQTDLKRVVAYSSINHLGYCLLGIFAALKVTGQGASWDFEKAAALNGVILQMFNHGLSAAALFCFIGLIESRSGGLRGLNDFGGLRVVAPVFCGLMGVTVFSSLGLPGLNGFIGEILIFKGVFALSGWAAAVAVLGLLLTAVFLLNILQKVFCGPLPTRWNGFRDTTPFEQWMLAPILALMFLVGLYPQCVMRIINPTVMIMVGHLS